jgi:hypothetical protein
MLTQCSQHCLRQVSSIVDWGNKDFTDKYEIEIKCALPEAAFEVYVSAPFASATAKVVTAPTSLSLSLSFFSLSLSLSLPLSLSHRLFHCSFTALSLALSLLCMYAVMKVTKHHHEWDQILP